MYLNVLNNKFIKKKNMYFLCFDDILQTCNQIIVNIKYIQNYMKIITKIK